MPPGGTLADYVPFYFTPKSPMLLNIHTGYGGIQRRTNDEIVILVTAIPTLIAQGIPFLFTDRHAYTGLARFSADPGALPTMIDWDILRRHDFARTTTILTRWSVIRLRRWSISTCRRPLFWYRCASAAVGPRRDQVRDAAMGIKMFVRPGGISHDPLHTRQSARGRC